MVSKKNEQTNLNFLEALKALCVERDVSPSVMFDAIESALMVAYKKNFVTAQNVEVNIDRQNGTYHVYAIKEVVDEVLDDVHEISLLKAQEIDPECNVGDKVKVEVTPRNFGRIAAQAAKQFVVQKVREVERGMLYEEFSGKENDIVSGTIIRIENGDIILDIGKAEAILLMMEQINGEHFNVGDRLKAYIVEVKKGNKGPQIYVSRTHPGLLKRLFELEVPEIQEGIIEIKQVTREPGSRSKVAVFSKDPNIEPVGSCVGQKGVRIQAIMNEIPNEKIDIITWNPDPAVFIANSLSPAKIRTVSVLESEKFARVVVPNNQLSLAIGKEGQNARLAARLTNWKIDIKSASQAGEDTNNPEMREVVINSAPEKPQRPKKNKKFKKNRFNKNRNPNQQNQNQNPAAAN